MKKKKIIVSIKFNNWAYGPTSIERLSESWIKYRISIFMNYTLKSLVNQTNQDFTTVIQYDEKSEKTITEELKKYKKLPENIIFTSSKNSKALIDQLIIGFDQLYLVRLDSDDMYHKSFIDYLHNFTPKEETMVLINQHGYIYDAVQNEITTTYRKSPPFYVLIYKTKDYLEGNRYSNIGGHTAMIKLPHEIFDERNFTIVVHSKNVLTKFNTRKSENNYDGDDVIVDPKKINLILKDFM